MKKRLLSWLLVLTMVISLIPSTLVTTAFAAENPSAQASGQAGKTTHTMVDELPSDLSAYDIWDVRLTKDTQPGGKITVPNGKTLIIHGTGGIAGGTRNDTIVFVEKGGHLVLDGVLIQNNAVDRYGAIYVKSGGLLDLGYNDQSERRAPSITNNKFNSAAKNLVIEDGATVRLNAQADRPIGVSYYKDGLEVGPFIAISGGRYTMRGTQDGNINGETSITSDNAAKWKLMYSYDNLIMTNNRARVLVWDPTNFWSYEGASYHKDTLYKTIQNAYNNGFDVVRRQGTKANPCHLTATELAQLDQFDLIVFDCATVDLTTEEFNAYLAYLNNGGRILFQVENAGSAAPTDLRNQMNTKSSEIAQSLGGQFTAHAGEVVSANTVAKRWTTPARAAELTKDMSNSWGINVGAYITSSSPKVYPLMTARTNKGNTSYVICDQDAGDRDGSQWGALTIVGDTDVFHYSATTTATSTGGSFIRNLVLNTVTRRISAAAGVNPNSEFNEWQATTTTTTEATSYRTPYAALQKAVENNTVTLLLSSRGGSVDSVSNELLFEKSTLAYEVGSTYAGSTIHADTAGVYLDITKTGEVNLHGGTVTVTPKDANYPLVLNGTMDTDGNAITGGYKITSATPYQLDADDDTTKIKAGNGGGASITIPTAGTSVTVAYTGGTDGKLNGKTITYTATEDNEKFYLGCYTVSYEVEGNVTWTETDLAWDGHDFETKMTPATGFDAHGEKLAVVDIANSKTYDMENGGTEGTGTETWGVFNSKTKLKDGATPKITVKQQYLHENNVDRNGYATVTVRNVREDITIRTTGNAVESSRPNIYVVGVGVKDGTQTQLWAYTTQRTTDDQVTTKDVEGWPWAKWKVVSAKTAKGTQAAYEGNQITTWTNETIKNSTTAGGALCPVKLTQGDMVVVFQYEWDMVNVKINAKLGEGDTAVDFPGYTTQYAEVQRDVESTIYAPNLSGYQPTSASTTITPTAGQDGTYGPYEVTFHYKLAMGQVIYRAVDAEGHELATWDGPRVLQGDTVSTDYALAPKLAGYQVKQQNGNATAANNGTADKYDGVNQITVTWIYEPKTRDVEVKMVEYTADGDHRGAELRTDTTSYAKSSVGFTLNLSAPAIPGYTVKEEAGNDEISKSKSVFVEDNDQGKLTVYFYYEVTTVDDAKITVQMWNKVNNEEIWSYTVPGQNGEKQLVRVPTVKGYVSDPANKDVSIAPDETINTDWGKGTVRFLYSPNTVKVTVKLVDSTKTAGDADYELNTKVPNYTGSYTVVKGESIDIVAPDVYGYTLADGQDPVHKLTVDKNESKTELTYTIKYIPANDGQVFVHVKGLDKDGNLCYEYTNSVTQGTASVDVTVFAVSGQKLTAATVGSDNKFADVTDGVLTVNTSAAAKGDKIEVVFTYGDNTADVTINAYYKDTTNTVEGFTPFTVKAEIGKPYSYGTLSLTGYDNDGAAPAIKDVMAQDNVLNYYFTKRTGNVIYQLVEEGNPTHILATKSESVAKDAAIDATSAKAPEATNWKLKDASNGTVDGATDGKYDGVHAVTVTYVAVPKTKTVTIHQMDVDTDKEIDTKTVELETGRLHTLEKATYLPDNGQYIISGLQTVEIYVEDDNQARSVNMYFRRSTDEYVTVNLVYMDEQNQKQTIQTYLVQRKPGTTIEVKAPDMAYKGYTAKVNSKQVAPTESSVEIEYTVTYYEVKIKLLDENNSALKTPQGYELTRKVRKGEGIVLTAPSIADYTLISALVVSKTAKELEQSADNRTITFQYKNTASANYVTHTIILMDVDNNKEITRYNNIVAKGTGKTTYYAPVQDGYQVDALTKEGDNSQSEEITFNYSKSAATITIHFVDKTGKALTGVADTELSGYEKGQTVMVSAPALTNYALAGQWKNGQLEAMTGVTATLTLSKTATNNEIIFAYEDRGDVTFVLKDEAGKDIQVINGVAKQEYSVAAGGKLDLRTSGWAFNASHKDNSTDFKTANASVTVAQGASGTYELHYTRITRNVTYKYWDVTNGENSKTAITFTDNDNPTTVNVGENFTAAAPQIAGYTANALRVVTFVMYDANNAAVEVNFNYIRKATGSVTVEHIVKNGSEEKVITSYTASGSVGEWFTATALTTDASGITTDGKYKFTESDTNKKTQTVKVGADAQTIKFVYEPNYVTVKTYTSVAGTKTEYQTGIEVVKTTGSQKLYAPSMTGYVLKGIEVKQGSNTDGGAKAFPRTGWNNNVLTLTGLTNDVEVVYYYEKINDNIKEYQATVTVKDQYASYELGSWTETVTKDVSSTITPKPHYGYILSGYQIGDSAGQKHTITKDQAANFVLTHKFTADANVTFFYDRADGSAVVPGEDTKFGTEDDVIIKPNGDKLPTVNADKSVNVPNGAEVVTPNGTVIPPDGSIVKPDGTIVAPDANGKTDPGVTIDPSNPDSAKATYFYVKYLANGGKGEVPTQFFKKSTEITLATNNLTADNKMANGWNTQENGQGKDYANGTTLTPTESMTLYAKWTASNYTHKVTITFNANTDVNSATKTQVIGSYTSTAFGGTLDANTFTLDGWTFRGWNTERNGSGTAYTNEQEVTFTSASGHTLMLYAQWYRFNKDSSITVPGSDSTPNTDKDVTIHPNGNDKPSIDDKGNVKVPNGAEVTTPNGTIIPPNGSIVKPDGTIVAPDDKGSTEPGIEIDPNKPGDTTNKFITVTYKYGRTDKQVADVVQYGKGTVTIMTGNPFTAPTGYQFDGWKVEGSNDKFTGTEVNASTTLVAQWKLAGSVVLAPDKTTDSGKRLETGAKDGELKLVMRGDWAQDKTLTLGALVDGKQSTNEVYWRVDADSYKNEFGFTNSVLTGDQIVSVDANTGKLTVLNSGIVRVWCISKVNPDIKFSVVVVVPGDVNKDGLVDADDIDWTYRAVADSNFVPTQDAADTQTWYIKDLAVLHTPADENDKTITVDDLDILYNLVFAVYGI